MNEDFSVPDSDVEKESNGLGKDPGRFRTPIERPFPKELSTEYVARLGKWCKCISQNL